MTARQWFTRPAVGSAFVLAEDRGHGSPCWIWQGALSTSGYGLVRYAGVMSQAHRAVYRDTVGPIADGLQLDHLCRVRSCCNPEHLEAVTPRVNTLRSDAVTAINAAKTHCPQGHPYSGTNLYLRPSGGRACRECDRAACRKRYHARKAAA